MGQLATNIDSVLGKPTNAGSSYRQMLAFMIKKAEGFKFTDTVPKLKAKLGEAFKLAGDKAAKLAGENAANPEGMKYAAMAKKAYSEAAKLGINVIPGNTTPAKIVAPKKEAQQKAKEIIDKVAAVKPTADELKKAESTYPLGKHLLPFVDDDKIKLFNDKFSGTNTPKTPDGLATKVTAFKVLQVVNEDGKQKAEAAALEKAKAEKAKAAAEAKANAEKNKQYMESLGINEQEALGFAALAKIVGGNPSDLIESFKKYENEAKNLGYPITGFQTALIKNYSDGGYHGINTALRAGSITEAQHVYVKMVNKALQAMPTYKGTLRRGSHLSPEVLALYKPGHIVEERAFTSSSISDGFGGNAEFRITAIGKRGAHIKKLSHYPGEDEVVFSARTFFKVTKVENSGGKTVVHMEEMDD